MNRMASRRAALPALLALLVLTLIPAQARAAHGQSLNLSAGLGASYDDNFLELSDNQLSDFSSGLHPRRYSVRSTDDVLYAPDLALTWQFDERHGRRHALRARYDGNFHSRNGTADCDAAGLRWTESFPRDRRLSAGWYRLNNFYLRQLRDEDLPAPLGEFRYQRAQFDLDIWSANWRQRLGRSVHAEVAYQFERRAYLPAFRERDSGTHQAELHADWSRLSRSPVLDVHLGYLRSDAKAADGDEAGGVADDDDVSYHGFEGGVGAHTEFRRSGSWRLGGDLAWETEHRAYDSNRLTDRYHYGRHDTMNAVEAGLRLGYRPHWGLRAYYRLQDNAATLGASAPPSSDSGTYRENRFGLQLDWTGRVWHQAAAVAESAAD